MYTITVQGNFPAASLRELMESLATVAQVLDEGATVTVSPFGTAMHELLEKHLKESFDVHTQRTMDIVKDDGPVDGHWRDIVED